MVRPASSPADAAIGHLLECLLLGSARRLLADVAALEAGPSRRSVRLGRDPHIGGWVGDAEHADTPQAWGDARRVGPHPDLVWSDLALGGGVDATGRARALADALAPGAVVAVLEVVQVRTAVLDRWMRRGLGVEPGPAGIDALVKLLSVRHRSEVRSTCGQLLVGIAVARR